ncbi:uncharacterized protein LOC118644649 [Monomorium pharaonis]|uniref:uncharacterized protein LOC118644649 n=1 Tax=Monomorium pharaonis TaxID=307658 RepID=UPI001745F163|nr:uncharacterized protein LOC118644649 [Monomorium pharaonis]
MKNLGVIEESQSPWVSPAVLTKKKDRSIRFCVYRKLNAITIKDSFPLPRIDDIFDQLSGCRYCAKVEEKSSQEPVDTIARIIIPEYDLAEWLKDQRKYSSIAIFIREFNGYNSQSNVTHHLFSQQSYLLSHSRLLPE